jgi:hypothetical protein
MPARTVLSTVLAARRVAAGATATLGALAVVGFMAAHHPAVIAGVLWSDRLRGGR